MPLSGVRGRRGCTLTTGAEEHVRTHSQTIARIVSNLMDKEKLYLSLYHKWLARPINEIKDEIHLRSKSAGKYHIQFHYSLCPYNLVRNPFAIVKKVTQRRALRKRIMAIPVNGVQCRKN